MSYNDNIYKGFREALKVHENLAVEAYTPIDEDDAEKVIAQWFAEKSNPAVTDFVKKRLLVLADASFEALLEEHRDWRNSDGNEILWLDSRNLDSLNVYSRYIPLYGASHLAGQVIHEFGVEKAACVLANPVLEPLEQSFEGFRDGFKESGGTFDANDAYYLATSASGGFNMADSLYRLSYELDSAGYRFVFPVAGGSSAGILRYTREFADSNTFYTCGMDSDQQAYSKRVAFSVIKRMDTVVKEFVNQWMADSTLEMAKTFGLLDGYADIVIADAFKDAESKYAKQREIAATAEEEYLKKTGRR
ncbi:BMP family ABC transporter substrate-binding protein [Fibrobacter sp.]|uniref:BMP family ABC transporter substrate-binding protein n=1 Tax=Fibrobacter sp. TaxID=35828 RepID=UPI00388FBA2E